MNKVELKASARVLASSDAEQDSEGMVPYGGRDRVRYLEVKLQRYLRKNPNCPEGKNLMKRVDESSKLSTAEFDKLENEIQELTRLKAKTAAAAECTADAGEDHWINQVRAVLRLARGGKGAMKMSSADQENNTVTIEMKPQMYLDPNIMMKMLIIFKREGLAMVVGSHIANLVTLTVGPEGFLEEQV